jgi:ribosomal protein S27AE
MRRILILGTAFAVLAFAAAAYAATQLNTYKATVTFTPNKTGSSKKPVATGFTQNFKASNVNSADRTAPIRDIKSTYYGVVVNYKKFPKCTLSFIANHKNDIKCPKGSMVASGTVKAVIGSATDPSATGTPCFVLLHVYNEGNGKLVYFFVTNSTHVCLNGGITTGTLGPFESKPLTVKNKSLILDVPIPAYIAFPLNAWGSLTNEVLKYSKYTIKKSGKTYSFWSSVGCKSGKRPISTEFSAETSTKGPLQSVTIKADPKCS